MKAIGPWPEPMGTWVPEFNFTDEQTRTIEQILLRHASPEAIAAFTEDVREILETWRDILNAPDLQMSRPADRRKQAARVARAAKSLRVVLRRTKRDALDLIDQGFWIINRIRYPQPFREHVREIDEQLESLTASADWLAAKPIRRGSPGKNSLVKVVVLIAQAYEKRLNKKPAVAREGLFAKVLNIALPVLGDRSTDRYDLIRRALRSR